MTNYRQLDEGRIITTIEELHARIGARFPEANLKRVCEQLLAVAREVSACSAYLRRPNWGLRIAGVVAALVLLILLLTIAGITLNAPVKMGLSDLVQTIEAAVNDVIFFGIAVFFLLTIETRVKRRRALAMLHELRSLAHVVDMHQLTKDPERLSSTRRDDADRPRTTGLDLARYLDFCSELLSLTSKVAALLVQHFDDGAVLAGVNEIEALTTGLSGKIWQKITMIERANTAGEG
jgi:hypothetical protein